MIVGALHAEGDARDYIKHSIGRMMQDQDLFQELLLNRLEHYQKTYDPVQKFEHQGHVHKTIQLGYKYKQLKHLAIELFTKFFVSIIRQKPLPDWVDLLDQAFEITRTCDTDQFSELLICRCHYLRAIDNFDGLYSFTNQALQSPEIQENSALKVDILIFSGSALLALRQFEKAGDCCQEGLNIMEAEPYVATSHRYGRLVNILGAISYSKDLFKESYRHYMKALDLLEQSDDLYYAYIVRENLTRSLAYMDRLPEALAYQTQIHDFYTESNYLKAKNQFLVAMSHIYMNLQHFDMSEELLLQIDFDYLCQIPPSYTLALYHNNLGYLYFLRQAYELAEKQLLGAIDTFRKVKTENRLKFANSLGLLGTIYDKLNNDKSRDIYLTEAYILLDPLSLGGDMKARDFQREILREFPHIRVPIIDQHENRVT